MSMDLAAVMPDVGAVAKVAVVAANSCKPDASFKVVMGGGVSGGNAGDTVRDPANHAAAATAPAADVTVGDGVRIFGTGARVSP